MLLLHHKRDSPQSLNPTNTSRGPVFASAFSACQRKSVGARFYIGASVFKLFAAGTSAARTSSAGIAPPALRPKTALSVKGVKVSLLFSVRWPRKYSPRDGTSTTTSCEGFDVCVPLRAVAMSFARLVAPKVPAFHFPLT